MVHWKRDGQCASQRFAHLTAFVADLDLQEDGVATLVETFRLEFAQAEGRRTIPIVNSQFANRYGDREELPLEIRATYAQIPWWSRAWKRSWKLFGLQLTFLMPQMRPRLRQRKIELVQVLERSQYRAALREQFRGWAMN